MFRTDIQYVAREVKSSLEAFELKYERAPSTRTAAHLTKRLCYNMGLQSVGVICVGCDGDLYSVLQSGALILEEMTVQGSGSGPIMAYCDSHFREDMSREECAAFVESALQLAASRDAHSGGDIQLYLLCAAGAVKLPITAAAKRQADTAKPFAWR